MSNKTTDQTTWKGIDLMVSSEDISTSAVWNIHENRHALILHLGGRIDEIETEIDKRASKIDPPSDGEFWLIPAGAEYYSFTRGAEVNYAEFFIEPEYVGEIIGEKARRYELAAQIGKFDSFLFETTKYLISLLDETDDISELMRADLSRAMCLHLFRKYSSDASEKKTVSREFSRDRFELIQEFIHDNLAEQIQIKTLANVAGVGPDTLLRRFRKSFGTTPAQYVIEQRLRKVRWMLTNSKKDLTSISMETGFSSHSHMTTTFKNHVGVTPAEFRNLR